MSGSCPVGADVCREAHAEVERLRHEVADLRRSRDERKATERARRRADREAFAATMQGEFGKANAEVERLRALAIWLIHLDQPDGIEERRTVTLTKIIDRAYQALEAPTEGETDE